jgi:hypothetical protein
MSVELEWDGDRRVGPVYLGMTLDECRRVLPGSYDDSPAVSDPSLLADIEPAVTWFSDEYGVMVAFRNGTATFITCNDHFSFNGRELVGQPLETALTALGGRVRLANDFDTLQIIETERGPEVWTRDGVVTCISINCENDD